jgi:VanZ family protein
MPALRNLLRSALPRYGVALIWTIYLTFMLLQTPATLNSVIQFSEDELIRETIFTLTHLLLFSLMTLLWLHALQVPAADTNRLRQVAVAILCYTLLTELAQGLVPGRSIQITDLVANGLGTLAGFRLYYQHLPALWARIKTSA